MTKLFISHSSRDDAFVRDLRAALADHGQEGWIDSRELRGGDPLWLEIKKAIDASEADRKRSPRRALRRKKGQTVRPSPRVEEGISPNAPNANMIERSQG